MTERVKPVGKQQAARTPGKDVKAPRRQGRLRGALSRIPPRLRFAIFLFLGIAVTAAAGYLVAALWFFPAPLRASERTVVSVLGLTEREAQRELDQRGLLAAVAAHEPYPAGPAGLVIWQDPPPGVAVPRGSTVELVLSSGLPKVVVPDVRGYDVELAQLLLSAAGLRVDGIDSVDTKDLPVGLATGTMPAAGDSVAIGRTVMLHLARQGI